MGSPTVAPSLAQTPAPAASTVTPTKQFRLPYLYKDGTRIVGEIRPDGTVIDYTAEGGVPTTFATAVDCLLEYGMEFVADLYLQQLAECFGGIPLVNTQALAAVQPQVPVTAEQPAPPRRQPKGAKAAAAATVTPAPAPAPETAQAPVAAPVAAPAPQAPTPTLEQQIATAQAQTQAYAQSTAPLPVPAYAVQPALPLTAPTAQPLSLLEKLQALELAHAAVSSPGIVDVQHHIAQVRAAEKYLTGMCARLLG